MITRTTSSPGGVSRRRSVGLLALASAGALILAACGGDDATVATTAAETTVAETTATCTLTVYSGRGEDLVAPVIDAFSETTGIAAEVRYGNSAEMLLLIQEEGDNTPADVYYSQGAGFLGLLAAEGRLAELDDEIMARLADPNLGSPNREWVGLTGRARTAVYNTDLLSEDDLPDLLVGFTDPQWSGKIGWAPSNASFQDHVTALRFILGEDGAREWLEGMLANDPIPYENNGAILDAVAAGEIEVGLTNHYYLYRRIAEDPSYPVANKYYTDGDPGALVNIAGAGVLTTTECPAEAQELIAYLLSVEAQEYFTETNQELPVVIDVEPSEGLPRIDSLVLPAFDLNQLLDLEGTVDLLIETGAL